MKNDKEKQKVIKAFLKSLNVIPEDSFNTMMFKKYIELKGSVNLLNYLNSNGYRIKTQSSVGQRKYTSLDIHDFMLNEENQKGVDSRVVQVVIYLIEYVGRAEWERRLWFAINNELKNRKGNPCINSNICNPEYSPPIS